MTSKTAKAIQKHTLLESLLYHLVPGILIAVGYFPLAPIVKRAGYPPVMALILTAIFILVPVELGWCATASRFPGTSICCGCR